MTLVWLWWDFGGVGVAMDHGSSGLGRDGHGFVMIRGSKSLVGRMGLGVGDGGF